jgi:hypothetical protein
MTDDLTEHRPDIETMYGLLITRGFPLLAASLREAGLAWDKQPNPATTATLRRNLEAARAGLRVSSLMTRQ